MVVSSLSLLSVMIRTHPVRTPGVATYAYLCRWLTAPESVGRRCAQLRGSGADLVRVHDGEPGGPGPGLYMQQLGAGGSPDGQSDQRARPGARSHCGVTARARRRPGPLPAVGPRLGSELPAPSARRSRCWRIVRLAVPRFAALPDPPLLAARRAAAPGHSAPVHSPGSSAAPTWTRMTGSYRRCAATPGTPSRPWRHGARWHRRNSRPRRLPRAAAIIRSSVAVHLPAADVVRSLAGPASVVAVRLRLSRLCPWWRGCRRTIARSGRWRLRGAGVRRLAA